MLKNIVFLINRIIIINILIIAFIVIAIPTQLFALEFFDGSVVIFDLVNEIELQNGPDKILSDYQNGYKWIAYFSASYHGNGLTLAVDLPDYLGITQEGQSGWVTVWTEVNLGYTLGLPFGCGVIRREYGANAPDDHTDLFECSAGGTIPFISIDTWSITSHLDIKSYVATLSSQADVSAGLACQFHGLSIEIKREMLNYLIYQAMLPNITLNNCSAAFISRVVTPDPTEVSLTDMITSFRFTTDSDNTDEIEKIQDIRYDYLVIGEWSRLSVDVYVEESDYYKMEVRSGLLASPYPAWDWSPRVIENVWLNANELYSFVFQVRPDTESESFRFYLYQKDVLDMWKIIWYLNPYELNTVSTVPDRISPEILTINTNSYIDSNIDIVFSEEMAPLSFTTGTVIVEGDISGIHAYSKQYTDRSLTLDPEHEFSYDETVTIHISRFVQDIYGNELDYDYSYNFDINSEPGPEPSSIMLNTEIYPYLNVSPYSNITITGNAEYDIGTPVTTATIEINTGDNIYTSSLYDGHFSQDCVAPENSRNIIISIYGDVYNLEASTSCYVSVQDENLGGDLYDFGNALSCLGVMPYDPYLPLEGTETRFIPRYEDYAYVWLELDNVCEIISYKWEYSNPDGQVLDPVIGNVTDPELSGYECWPWWRDYSWIYNFGYDPGRWSCMIFVDEGYGYELQKTVEFTIGYEYVENRMAKGVDPNTYQPTNVTNSFSPIDDAVYSWWQIDNLCEDLDLKWEWIDPQGNLYAIWEEEPMSDYHLGPGTFEPPYDEYYSYCYILINGYEAAYRCGSWQVNASVKNIEGNWELVYTDVFEITEHVSPIITISCSQDILYESQIIDINVIAQDNNHLDKIILKWNDGEIHQQTLHDSINNSNYTETINCGTFVAGQIIEYWAIATDESGNSTESNHLSLLIKEEYVHPPICPEGLQFIVANCMVEYVTEGAYTSLSNPIEYRFDWGDGSLSDWGISVRSKSWLTDDQYSIKAQARSQVNVNRISEWSSEYPIIVDSQNPILNIYTNNGGDTLVYHSPVQISGYTSDYMPSSGIFKTIINTEDNNIGDEYEWLFEVPLLSGENLLIITSTDNSGNYGKDSIVVYYSPYNPNDNIWHVRADGMGEVPTIQDGINASSIGDTVLVAPGTYRGEGNRDIDFLGKSVTVISELIHDPLVTDSTIIDCEGATGDSHRGFIFQSGETNSAILDGFIIENGYNENSIAETGGGGICCLGGSDPTIRNNIVRYCAATVGGGIAVYESSPYIYNNKFYNNSGSGPEYDVFGNGCAIFLEESSSLIYGNTIHDNGGNRGYGGGVYCSSCASLVIDNNTIFNNSVEFAGSGGGLHLASSSAIIKNNWIYNNSADDGNGGGIHAYSCTLDVDSNTVEYNSADKWGGGIYAEYSFVSIKYNDIKNNEISDDGAGIYLSSADSTAIIGNNIIDNSAGWGKGGGIYYSGDSRTRIEDNIVSNNSKCGIYIGSGAVVTNNMIIGNNGGWDATGGGIYCSAGAPYIANNIIAYNFCHHGGGILCEALSGTITNNTIVKNEANQGAGIYFGSGSETSLERNIIAYNNAIDMGGGIYSDISDINILCCDVYGNVGQFAGDDYYGIDNQAGLNGNFSEEPRFCNLTDTVLTLRTDSPCLPANHPYNYTCDLIGACELGCACEEPFVSSINDIADDQGKLVTINWFRSSHDSTGNAQPITIYEIYRRIDDLTESMDFDMNNNGDVGLTDERPVLLYPPGTWDYVQSIEASMHDMYSIDVPTLKDSSVVDSTGYYSIFFIRAATSEPSVYFDSPIDSGYSIDNLAPTSPSSFTVVYNDPSGRSLTWNRSSDPDFNYFNIYRGLTVDFEICEDMRVHQTVDTSWVDDGSGDGVWGHYYKLTTVDISGNESVPAVPEYTTEIEDHQIPSSFVLHQNLPNPFNPSTTIKYSVPDQGGFVFLSIYDIKGRLIKTLVNEHKQPGIFEVVWAGCDNKGQSVSSGIYFCRLISGGSERSIKLVLLR